MTYTVSSIKCVVTDVGVVRCLFLRETVPPRLVIENTYCFVLTSNKKLFCAVGYNLLWWAKLPTVVRFYFSPIFTSHDRSILFRLLRVYLEYRD
jgi:hypothetical protein